MWMAVIFSFSNQTGQQSASMSDGLIAKVTEKVLGDSVSSKTKQVIVNRCSKTVRKTGHFTIYFILALLTSSALSEFFKGNSKIIIYTIFICFCYAISDEFHQLFISERSGEALDVLIDTSGTALACFFKYKLTKKGRGNMLLIEYPNCSTCKKAKKFLTDKNLDFNTQDVVNDTPTEEDIKSYLNLSKLPLSKFFNTSGMKYKELKLKEKLPQMSDDEKISLLASDGMLIKRPILVLKDKVLLGFKEQEWEEALSNIKKD